MPTVSADDGRGATLTLGTGTWGTAALITSIQPDAITRAALETTYLGTATARTFIPEDLVDNGGFTIEFLANGSDTNAKIPVYTAPETLTITYAVIGSNSTGQIITSTLAFCTEYTPPTAVAGELLKGSAKFKWNGVVTYTAAT
jgi:hypothetical protein